MGPLHDVRGQIALPFVWCGRLQRSEPGHVSSLSSHCGSKLRGSSQNSPRVASKRVVNITKLNGSSKLPFLKTESVSARSSFFYSYDERT
ncbi:hypothetical protein AVEN_40246-1 [Araneus ventricosus]|uniref:Uncharacterized protein n=1 Tax=Araneus ventricosus TaxID=182803 RepID=A0A4Y2JEV8_ARAVE|nr:hypothetical protein AVEN_40246-1 [Araneus ventricosus]